MRKPVFGIMLLLLLISTLALAFNIQPVKAADGIIYIRADGSIDPPTAPISHVGNTYTFMTDINATVIVERNNTIIDGNNLTLSTGYGFLIGLDAQGNPSYEMDNVTIKNTNIGGGAWRHRRLSFL